MSLPKQAIEPAPEDTVQVAQKAFPRGNPYIRMRDLLSTIYTDDVFADLYPPDGQPAIRPWCLALVTVMQFAENLTDRQAADAVRDRIAWKYALSLSLTDAGFDYSVLCKFRQRLLDHDAVQQLLDVMLKRFAEQGWLKIGGKQRSDSTHILAAIRRLNQLELVHETLRHWRTEHFSQQSDLPLPPHPPRRQQQETDDYDGYSPDSEVLMALRDQIMNHIIAAAPTLLNGLNPDHTLSSHSGAFATARPSRTPGVFYPAGRPPRKPRGHLRRRTPHENGRAPCPF